MRCARGAVLHAAFCCPLLPCGSLPHLRVVLQTSKPRRCRTLRRGRPCTRCGAHCRVGAARPPMTTPTALSGAPDVIRRRGDRRCSRCSASTCARSATHVKILRCRLQLADGRQGQGRLAAHPRHPLARRLRAVTTSALCCGFAGPHRWRMGHTGTVRERERGSEAELGDYAPLDWHADAVRPARPQHSATERACAVGLADANVRICCFVLLCSGGEAQPSLPGSVELAGTNLGGPSSLAESAGRRDHDQVSRCSAPLQVLLFKRRLEHSAASRNMPLHAVWHELPCPCSVLWPV